MKLKARDVTKKSNMFIKYIISYVCVMLLPVVILSLVVFGIFVERLKNEIVNNTISALNKSKLMIDTQISQIYGTYYQIMDINKTLKTYIYVDTPSPINDLYIKNELRKHIASNFFISEVVLCSKNNNYIYTSEGVYPKSLFINSIYCYDNWNIEDFERDIFDAPRPFVRPAETVNKDERYVTFVFPPYMSTDIPNSALLFLVREEKIANLLLSNVDKFDGNSFIVDNKNQIITVTNNEVVYFNELKEVIASETRRDYMFEKKIGGESFYVFVTKSDYLGWKYVSLLPAKSVMSGVVEAKIAFFVGLIMVFILGTATILFFMKINYEPIKQLKAYIEKLFNRSGENLNEIETVREAIDYLVNQNAKLSNDIKKSIVALRDSLVFSLIRGQINSIEEFNSYGKEIDINFSKKIFQIIIIRVSLGGYDRKVNRQNIIDVFDECVFSGYEYFIRENVQKNEYIGLLAFDEINKDRLNEMLRNFMEKFRREYNTFVTIGVGDECRDVQALPRSYMNASTALKHMFIRGNNQIIHYNEIINYSLRIDDYPHEEIKKLNRLIRQGNIKKIKQLINWIIDYIKKRDTPIFIARAICFEIIYEVFKADEDVVLENKYPDIFVLEKIDTIEQLSDIISELCLDICTALKRKRENLYEEENFIDNIINFIKQNYDNCNFSTQMIADNFGMSLSYLSQYFKANVGKTISDYITELRIQKAKKLLDSTNFSISNISEEVGYYNVSSFIRRFKQVTGITPGEYREKAVK